MHTILKRLPVSMVFEAGKSVMPSGNLIAMSCRTEAHLATKLNGVEYRSYEVIDLKMEIDFKLKFIHNLLNYNRTQSTR